MSHIQDTKLISLLAVGNTLGREDKDFGCPYRRNCSLYQSKGALTPDARTNMCEYDGGLTAPKIGWIHDTDKGTVCEAYLGKKALEVIHDIAGKVSQAPNSLKHDLGSL